MTRHKLVFWFFIALLVFVISQVFLIFSPFIQAIFWSAILAFGFYPLYTDLRRWVNYPTVAALATTILIVLVVVPPLMIMFSKVALQAVELYESVSTTIQQGQLEPIVQRIRTLPIIHFIETHLLHSGTFKEQLAGWLLDTSRAIGNLAKEQALTITKNVLFVILNASLTMFLVFAFLRHGEAIYRFIYHLVPLEERNKKIMFKQINDTLSAVIRGQLLTSLAQAVLAGLIFWVLGIPIPMLLAAATFLATLIPVAGAACIWMPVVVYLATSQQWNKAIVLLVAGTFGISLLDNLLKPLLIGEKTKLPYLLLFFGILGGLRVYGLMGIVLAPTLLSLFFALARIYREEYLSS